MGEQMPSLVKCGKCSRTFPVRAQMQFDDKSLPMLVVLSQVDSVEAALEQATCQVCLDKTGSPDRGLYEVLKKLGLKDKEDEARPSREAAVVVRPVDDRPAGKIGVVVVSSRPREAVIVDSLMGTSFQVIHQEPLTRDRRPRDSCRDDWRPTQSEPRVPRALREPERRKPPSKGKHFTGAICKSGDNAAVLGVAMKAAKEREQAKWREHARVRNPEVVTFDAFEGGRRPEFWDEKGGKKPAFYQLEVVQAKNSLPVPNPPLPGGDDDPRPRIVYPQGGGYGPDYTVENSRREGPLVRLFDWELKPFGWALIELASRLGDHLDFEIKVNETVLNLSDLVCSFAEPIVIEEEDDPVVPADDTAPSPTNAIISPELPANT